MRLKELEEDIGTRCREAGAPGVVLSIGISCSGDLLSKVAAKSGTGEAMTLSSSRYGDAAVEVIGGESYRFISKNRSICSEYLYLRTSGEFAGGMDDSGEVGALSRWNAKVTLRQLRDMHATDAREGAVYLYLFP
jgi:hypothetical protein